MSVDDIAVLMLRQGGVFRHYKGGCYKVLGVASVEARPAEEVVVYQSLADGRIWTRPVENFLESLEVAGERVQRFQALPVFTLPAPGDGPEQHPLCGVRVLSALKRLVARIQGEFAVLRASLAYRATPLSREHLENLTLQRVMPQQIQCTVPSPELDGISLATPTAYSLEDLVVTMLIRLRLDDDNWSELSPDTSMARRRPRLFVQWLDGLLTQLGWTDQWLQQTTGISQSKPPA